jgi:hypothetical protein
MLAPDQSGSESLEMKEVLLMVGLGYNWRSGMEPTRGDGHAREQNRGPQAQAGVNLSFMVQPSHDLEYGLALRT